MIHHAKKSLSQNFLKSEGALRAMCTAADLNENDTVVEIGPGKGALTIKFLEQAKKVVAIEKDSDLVAFLQDKFKDEIESRKFELIEGDILDFDPKKYGLKEGKYKIIANIPYNITGLIIRYFLSEVIPPSVMVLLVQKEVAQRIAASDKKESILSLSVKVFGTPKYIMKVPKRFFSPSPKVDSAIIAISAISGSPFKTKQEENAFFTMLKASFAHKRKVLRKNLEDIAPSDTINSMFSELQIDLKVRAEDISLPLWLRVHAYLSKYI
jgi:16S rRNA (adenine1518-N6/adenine1519-N6)-dimethyltransferase